MEQKTIFCCYNFEKIKDTFKNYIELLLERWELSPIIITIFTLGEFSAYMI